MIEPKESPVGQPPRRRLPTPSPALVVASLALLLALAGSAYAAVALPRDSVGAAQLRTGAVTSVDVRNGSLQAFDLSSAARRELSGRIGPMGLQGPKGDPGPAGATGIEVVRAGSAFSSSPERHVTVDCPPGKRLLGGGAGAWGRAMISTPNEIALTASHPFDEDTWLAAAHEVVATDTEWYLLVNAICAVVG